MYKENKKEKKQICVNLSIEAYNLLEKNAEKRKLDKTNYIAHLIQNDRDDMYSEGASKALNKITKETGISLTRLVNIAMKEFLDNYNK